MQHCRSFTRGAMNSSISKSRPRRASCSRASPRYRAGPSKRRAFCIFAPGLHQPNHGENGTHSDGWAVMARAVAACRPVYVALPHSQTLQCSTAPIDAAPDLRCRFLTCPAALAHASHGYMEVTVAARSTACWESAHCFLHRKHRLRQPILHQLPTSIPKTSATTRGM